MSLCKKQRRRCAGLAHRLGGLQAERAGEHGQAAKDGSIIPLDGLAGAFPTTRERFFLAYAESVSAVDRIVRVSGRDALVKLIRSYRDGVSDDDAFRAALGRDVAGFQADWLAGGPPGVSPEAIADSPSISDLRKQLSQLEVKRAALMEDFTADHPEVVSLGQQIAKTKERVRTEIDRVTSGRAASSSPAYQELLKQMVVAHIDADGLKARREALAEALQGLEKRAAALPAKEMRYAHLLRDLRVAETVFNTLTGEFAKAEIEEARDADNFVVVDAAKPRSKPVKPRVKLTLALSVILGLGLGTLVGTVRGSLPKK
jgi:hypothetical protein